ncbi:MAG: type VI secretion system membrane subunit TssM, partial [Vicinamibacterales bacterium]|nr:type VI secretion system membrane subunit TssM [Vicinamibacterales bacterium]
MLSSPKMRVVLTILGLVMLGLFIWFAGPLFGFGDSRPLRPVRSRLIMMALVVVCWIAWVLIKRRRANRASDQLMAAVVEQPEASGPSPEAVQLRERFEDAIATLKKQRRSGHSLYDLPWYVIIGAPGSGKTTALLNSGLKFPVKQRTGAVALRGVGGTRDCDWWFTDEAVFLDTAGRYTTQDSDAAADSAGWDEFMALLRKYRKRRPVNGVLLTISAQDLMLQSRAELEAHVGALRRRLDELNQKLHIQLPVYLLVTKCDLVVGFTEYFDDLAQDGRSQVWGVTFPYERTVEGEAAGSFPAEFDALVARLNGRVFARLDEEHEARRRAVVFAFPQQMAALRDVLTGFVSEVFGSTRFDKQILLRGVYLTSGTQEGTPIDRLLGSIGRQFEVRPEAVLSREGQGKAYFIERLLKQVMFAESGLAGVNRRFEVQKAAWQFGAYAAMLLVAVLGVFAFTVSFVSNRNYVTEVGREAAALQNVQSAPATASLGEVLPRLDAVRGVYESANRYRDAKPWG